MTTTQLPPVRSALFVPGDRPERFAKAAASGADLTVIDLEDAVAPDEKSAARGHIRDWLSQGGGAAVRINALTTPEAAADLDALQNLPTLVAVMVPMAEDPTELSRVAADLDVPVVALIETATGILNAPAIAAAPGVGLLALGHLDLANDLGSSEGREAMALPRSTLVVAASAANLPGPLDGVTTALDDPQAWADDAHYAAGLGFGGKLAIHPRQVAGINAAFAPTAEQVAWAQTILAAAQEGGVARVGEHMVDAPVIARAQRIIDRAEPKEKQ